MNKKEKIIVGISGGVDSSVAALLLLEQGYEVEGLFMKNWEEDDDTEYCAAAEDLADAQSVCDELGIKLHSINFATEYWDRVFKHFLDEYSAGRTPNPDILCNKEIKFRAFLDHALDLGADKIATGHYARTATVNGKAQLLRGLDNNKDQSYFLYTLNQHQLSHTLFPVGEYQKEKIRKLAEQRGLTTYNKKDSTGICFIGERRFDTFLKQYLPAKLGDIKTTEGETIGTHSGLMYYTMGQRKGLGIGGLQNAAEDAWFVVDKNLDNNTLIVGQGHNHPRMLHNTLECKQLHWVDPEAMRFPMTCTAKNRYRQPDQACKIEQISEDHHKVSFTELQRAITPGQSVVFYHDEVCLGGGVIETMYNS
ncbi:MAG: tRNA 2-thiouridine(34) synthase MnmA [Gammaproteobacteria bacterium]|nr:tRNA 2-thiouridine(34) synthase MnmA [Gammaproteobacteria bacterium]MCK5262428.1 tRNA 2-thiouridine(34) synthase MnmA [Gammaproteobacteria bacterium]